MSTRDTAAELQSIWEGLLDCARSEDFISVQQRLDDLQKRQETLMAAMREAREVRRDLREAQEDFDKELDRLVAVLANKFGMSFERATQVFGPRVFHRLIDSPLGARLMELKHGFHPGDGTDPHPA